MRGLARHWGLWLLLAAAAPLLVAFTGRGGIASFGDDSVSYLALARWMDGSAGEALREWLPWHSHFPPLFPLVLAATGAAHDFARAHAIVAIFAVTAIASLYRFVLAVTGRRDAAIATALVFMSTPTAWLSAKGILTEPLYLAILLEALRFHAMRMRVEPSRRDVLIFGVLLGAALLTRAAAAALWAAFAVQLLVAMRRSRSWRPWLAFVPGLAMAGAWIAVRPSGAQGYGATVADIAGAWVSNAPLLAAQGPALLLGGWTSSFSGVSSFIGDAPLPLAAIVALDAAAVVAIAGAVLRARRNALDGWYVLATLALLLAWVFDEENMRRLLYPAVPVMLLHAGLAIAAAARRIGRERYATWGVIAGAALLVALAAPAMASFVAKSRDDAPLVQGHDASASDMTEYFRIANVAYARAVATRHAAVLSGFASLSKATPPQARIMCVRPEYAAVLGDRPGAALDYAWDARRLAQAVDATGSSFVVATSLAKSDLKRGLGDGLASARLAAPYTRRALALTDDAGRDLFVLLAVDREALKQFLDAR